MLKVARLIKFKCLTILRVLKCAIILILCILPFLALSQNSESGIDTTQLELLEMQPTSSFDSIITCLDDRELYVYFPGGKDAPSSDKNLFKFISKNLTYPVSAIKDSIVGKVFVSFTIDNNGMISNTKIVNGSNPYFDSEVFRLISIMPDWIWDKKIELKDRKLTKRILPINFTFENKRQK